MQNVGCQRRARQLSVVLYDYITSLLSRGEVCPQLSELGFEVVEVLENIFAITFQVSLALILWLHAYQLIMNVACV